MKIYYINLFQTQKKTGAFRRWRVSAENKKQVIDALKSIGWNPRYYEIKLDQEIPKIPDISKFILSVDGKKDYMRPMA